MITYDAVHDVYVRDETHDSKSATEVRKLVDSLDVRANDRVLDIGARIGAFSRLCAQRGACVVAVEPEPNNIEVLRRNTQEFNQQVVVWPAAITDDPAMVAAGYAKLSIRGKTHTGLHTIVPPRDGTTDKHHDTIDVQVIAFKKALEVFPPTVLKVDIEGGEFMCDFSALPTCIRSIHVEMHMRPQRARGREKAPLLHALILSQGFEVVVPPRLNALWGTHPVYRRAAT